MCWLNFDNSEEQDCTNCDNDEYCMRLSEGKINSNWLKKKGPLV